VVLRHLVILLVIQRSITKTKDKRLAFCLEAPCHTHKVPRLAFVSQYKIYLCRDSCRKERLECRIDDIYHSAECMRARLMSARYMRAQ